MTPSTALVWLQTSAGASSAVHMQAPTDSIRMDQSPLPGGVASLFRFLFSGVPQWVQIGGVVLGVIGGIVGAVLIWRHRAAIAAWFGAKSHGFKVALGAGVATTLLVVGLAGGWSYNYMMHENDFCSSCHVMSTAFGKFQSSEHSKLECHACHQQTIFASAMELYYWVMDRPEKIPAHSPVPDRICGECHITPARDSVWKYISATAGHQVHMNSDSAALREVMCVSCHAKEVHSFAPTDLSCKQSGCHDKVTVRLGRMADQTSLHCATCHEFARPVSDSIPRDSVRRELVPFKPQCFTCHEMREALARSGLDRDPHRAQCGDCHNPHTQERAAGAIKSCATSTCHANADTLTAFHRGLGQHALDQCTSCHVAHTWKVESTDCITCHRTIFQDRPSARVPRRITSSSRPRSVVEVAVAPGAPARRTGGPSDDALEVGAPPGDELAAATAARTYLTHAPTAAASPSWTEPVDTLRAGQQAPGQEKPRLAFQHSRHRRLPCTTCHNSDRRHGEVVVRSQASCQGCHHASDQRAGSCAACHQESELTPRHIAVRVHATPRTIDVVRELTFEHARHAATPCGECHTDNAAKPVERSCTSCHDSHHVAARDCSACHQSPKAAHQRLAHDGCATCHTNAAVSALPPARSLCLTCHVEQLAHYAARDCVTCHRVSWNEVPREDRR